MLPVIATLSTQPESIPLGHRRHLALGSFWFGLFSIWTPMVFVLLPAQVATLVGYSGRRHSSSSSA
jgi:hypothetical protein